MVATWLIGRAIGRYNVIDVTWGLGFVVVAVVSFAWSSGDGDPTLRAVMLAIVAIWGTRLAVYLAWRSRGKGEDRRYALMFERAEGSVARYAAVHVFVPQAVAHVVHLAARAGRDVPALAERARAGRGRGGVGWSGSASRASATGN